MSQRKKHDLKYARWYVWECANKKFTKEAGEKKIRIFNGMAKVDPLHSCQLSLFFIINSLASLLLISHYHFVPYVHKYIYGYSAYFIAAVFISHQFCMYILYERIDANVPASEAAAATAVICHIIYRLCHIISNIVVSSKQKPIIEKKIIQEKQEKNT